MPRLLLVVLAVALSLPGCFRAGKWNDDPDNYERAFGQAPPDGVAVRRSWYWRSAHFTREEAYYFHFASHPELAPSFVRENGMHPMPRSGSFPEDETCFDRPSWFAPKTPGAYDIWSCSDHRQCVLLVDRTTRDVFVAACQL